MTPKNSFQDFLDLTAALNHGIRADRRSIAMMNVLVDDLMRVCNAFNVTLTGEEMDEQGELILVTTAFFVIEKMLDSMDPVTVDVAVINDKIPPVTVSAAEPVSRIFEHHDDLIYLN